MGGHHPLFVGAAAVALPWPPMSVTSGTPVPCSGVRPTHLVQQAPGVRREAHMEMRIAREGVL